MSRTFDIRFGQRAGIAGWFDSARNTFGWKGSGQLSIDANGMRIAVKRGLLSLLARPRSQQVAATNIREVYREGESLRVEFTTSERALASLQFWTSDRETAAEVVELLPTTRTIEIEDTETHGTRDPTTRPPAGAIAAVGVAVLAGCLLWLSTQRRAAAPVADASPPAVAPAAGAATLASPATTPDDSTEAMPAPLSGAGQGEPLTPEQARRVAIMAETPGQEAGITRSGGPRQDRETSSARLPTPAVAATPDAEGFVPDEVPEIEIAPAAGVVAIRQNTLAYEAARTLLAHFEERLAALTPGFDDLVKQFSSAQISRKEFAGRLSTLSDSWQIRLAEILESSEARQDGVGGVRLELLATRVYLRLFLDTYADGVRSNDEAKIAAATEHRRKAEARLERARSMVR